MKPLSILIEGWKQLPHSYSLVAQSLALELNKLIHQEVYFKDTDYFNPNWKSIELFNSDDQLVINSLTDKQSITDFHFRISFPFDFEPSTKSTLLTFVTCEYDYSDPI